jgi:hypothetical protein
MKQIWPDYSYSPTTNVLTLTGLNIDRDQLLLVTAADRGRIMYNFADSSVTASAFTSGANTALTLVATTAGLTTTAALVIYYDDQVASNSVTGTVELGPTSLNALESITVTMGQVTVTGGLTDTQLRASAVTIGGTVTIGNSLTIGSLPAISGTVTANPTGTQTIAGSVTIGAGTAQIGSVTASINGTVPVSGTFFQATQPVSLATLPALVAGTAQIGSVTVGNSVTIGNFPATQAVSLASLPALVAGTAQIGSVTASISNSVVTFYPLQGTAVSNTNFTSTTASTTLASAVAGREVLTVFSEGPGNLFISSGATCTTISYQVRLSAGDYWECPQGQLSLLHSAVFATAGTARVCQVS